MSIQRFPLAAIQRIRQYIQNVIAVDADRQSQTWAGLEETEEIPEPTSLDDLGGIFAFGGLSTEEIVAPQLQARWSVSTVNPGAALSKLPGIRLKPSWRLVSYLYQEGNHGAGMIFALPEELATTVLLEKALAESKGLKNPPKPMGALADFMEAIEGDQSPVSFIVASLVTRELREFGTAGHYRNWSHHRLIDAIPPQVQWQWQADQPKDLSPKVQVGAEGQAIVEFFTCRVSAGVALYRHLDQYTANHYKPKRIDKLLATVKR